MEPEPRPLGRPSKYDPAFCEQVREFLRDGYSVAAFAGHIGVASSTVKLWMQQHEDFSAAVKEGQAAAVLWWESRLRTIALNGGAAGAATSAIFGLKNRAPEEWRDISRQELTAADGEPLPSAIQVFRLPDNGRSGEA